LDHSWRKNGEEARFQVYLNKQNLGEEPYLLFRKNIDIGDIIGVQGTVFRSQTGEPTLKVHQIEILCKGIQNLPDKHSGYKDAELQQRHRELHLLMDPVARRRFYLRSQIFRYTREIMWEKGFQEVDVPTLQAVYGGGEATPFQTHVNALGIPVFLSIAPELFLKRYLVGMFDRVFFIGKNFRNEGIDRTHHPEFSCFEGYATYMDYEDVMDLIEHIVESLAIRVHGSPRFTYDQKVFDVSTPWKRIRMIPALTQKLGQDPMTLTKEQLWEYLKKFANPCGRKIR
jgi:lysyl-tRNA synthetase class 2